MERLNSEYNHEYQGFSVLVPIIPLRNSYDIDSAIIIFYMNSADSVISCTLLPHPKEWILTIDENRLIIGGKKVLKEHYSYYSNKHTLH